MNSGPLSDLTNAGAPRWAARRSSRPATASASIERSTTMAGHLTGVLVGHVEERNCAPVDGDVELEVHRPQGIRSDRAHRPDVRADPGEALLASLGGHLQPFVTPQA